MAFLPASLSKWLLKHAEGLRFPQLLVITGCLFFADLLIPDLIPLADELLLGLLTLLFSLWRKAEGGTSEGRVEKPPEKDITPPESL